MYSVRPSTRSTVCATTRLDLSIRGDRPCACRTVRGSLTVGRSPAPRSRKRPGGGIAPVTWNCYPIIRPLRPGRTRWRTCDSKSHCLLVSSTVWRRPRTSRTIVLRHKSPLGALELECGPLSGSVRFAEYNGIYAPAVKRTSRCGTIHAVVAAGCSDSIGASRVIANGCSYPTSLYHGFSRTGGEGRCGWPNKCGTSGS